tara:strand:- start:831 stop:1469 length:639 start_codon:yes stop_codon:yes gene_type:complete
MAFQTGLFWLHKTTGLVAVDADYYAANGKTVTASAISADVSANKTAVVDTGGASACYVKPLLNSSVTLGSGSGTTTATMDIWGGMGFGEPTQDNFQTGPKILYRLGDVSICTVTDDDPDTVSTTSVFTSPDGTSFSSFTGGGTGTDVSNDIFSQADAMNTSAPDMADIDLANVDIGFCIIPGIQSFSQLFFTFDEGSLDTANTANALLNLYY